jgi:hypothetical protein
MARVRRSQTVLSLMLMAALVLPVSSAEPAAAHSVSHAVKSKTIRCVKGKQNHIFVAALIQDGYRID